MLLGKSELKSATLGAVRFGEDTEGRFTCCRFTEKQCDYYKRTAPDFLRKTRAGSGIRLDFLTDASSVSFDCLMAQSSSRPFCFIDAYADGVMILHAGEKISEAEKEFHIAFALPGGKRRVTLYFPNLVSIAFGDVTLECATFFEPYYPRRRFLMLGDSITQGYDAIYPSLSYANRIGAHFDAEILNQSIGGECFNAGLIDPKLPFRPDLITVAYGTNDWTNLTSRDVLAHGADAFFSRLTDVYPDTKIAYISPLWRARLEGEPYRDRPTPTFCEGVALLESVAAKYGSIHIIHGGALTPHVCDFYSDGYLHPNDLGFSVYAENLERELEKLI